RQAAAQGLQRRHPGYEVSSQRYLPWNQAIGEEDFRQSARTTRPDSDPPEDAVRHTRGQLPGAKIGANRARGWSTLWPPPRSEAVPDRWWWRATSTGQPRSRQGNASRASAGRPA